MLSLSVVWTSHLLVIPISENYNKALRNTSGSHFITIIRMPFISVIKKCQTTSNFYIKIVSNVYNPNTIISDHKNKSK